MITDDPWTLGPGNWEVNVAITAERMPHELVLEAPLVDINYGVGHRLQLKLELPWVLLDADGREPIGGPGSPLLGVKWRLLGDTPADLAFSFYPQLEIDAFDRSVERGLVDDGLRLVLPVQLALPVGRVRIGFEAGWTLVESGEDEVLARAVAGTLVTEEVELMAEVASVIHATSTDTDLAFNVGARWELAAAIVLLASGGMERTADHESGAIAYVGVQFRW